MGYNPTPEQEQVLKDTKKGFDLKARLQNRGLRTGKIMLFLDEDLGVEYGWAYDVRNQLGGLIERKRGGIIGKIDEITAKRDEVSTSYTKAIGNDKITKEDAKKATESAESILEAFNAELEQLEAERAELFEKMKEKSLTVSLRAIPPVINKDCRRRAKDKLGITEKGIPKELEDDFVLCSQLFLMSDMIQSITDNETGEVNNGADYDECLAFVDYLSPSQFQRLDAEMGEIQFADAISREIEQQEDFS